MDFNSLGVFSFITQFSINIRDISWQAANASRIDYGQVNELPYQYVTHSISLFCRRPQPSATSID